MAEGTDSTKLTLKQRRFVDAYLANGGNGTRAALAAYDTEDEATACAIARENLRKPRIRAAIDEVMASEGMAAQEVLWRLRREAETAEAAKDRIRAIELLGKYLGLWQERIEVSGTISVDEVGELARAVKARLTREGGDG